jgi:hypothetical protein
MSEINAETDAEVKEGDQDDNVTTQSRDYADQHARDQPKDEMTEPKRSAVETIDSLLGEFDDDDSLSGYNYAYLDEHTKREVRRSIIKAISIPGHQVPYASRPMPLARGWGTGGIQASLSLLGPDDTFKVIDQGSDESVNAANIRRLASNTADVETTTDTTNDIGFLRKFSPMSKFLYCRFPSLTHFGKLTAPMLRIVDGMRIVITEKCGYTSMRTSLSGVRSISPLDTQQWLLDGI